jgi:alkanesulfonate monooxygenase SsuD/methylene tetrahydromethanopterin reductase-like flavin-dependent oxidoreductase (luciferase family)
MGNRFVLTPGPFGLSLPNRGVLFGAITVDQMLEMAATAESSRLFDSVWVGDSILAKPRLESVALLAAIAARTSRAALGPACMASFPLRQPLLLAQQWASLDVISGGRTIMVPCIGSGIKGAGGEFGNEYSAFGIDPATRAGRLEEVVPLLRRLWTEDEVSHQGEHYRFEDVRLEPKPIQPGGPPIWIASDPALTARPHLVERALRRVARFGDGWMTAIGSPEDFGARWRQLTGYVADEGRDIAMLHSAVHHMVNINDDAGAAYDEAKQFLDTYYMTDTTPERMEAWVSYGPPAHVADRLQAYVDAGVRTLIVRFASWEPMTQIRRAIEQVLPRVETVAQPLA